MNKIAFITAWLIISANTTFVSGVWKITPSYYDVTVYNDWNDTAIHIKVPTERELDEIKILSKFDHLEYYNGDLHQHKETDQRYKVRYCTEQYHPGFSIYKSCVNIFSINLLSFLLLMILLGNPFK